MKEVKLVIDGEVYKVELADELISALTEKKTGYERVKEGGEFYIPSYIDGEISRGVDDHSHWSDRIFDSGNYYSDDTVAKNNERADRLYRQLRRFAVEHRNKDLDWTDVNTNKYSLFYNHLRNKLDYVSLQLRHEFGNICFDSEETAELAIETFRDELIWYFTGYKDSL